MKTIPLNDLLQLFYDMNAKLDLLNVSKSRTQVGVATQKNLGECNK